MKQIKIYHTHTEISPYELGENEHLEKILSIYLEKRHKYDPIGYCVKDGILYVPRGINQFMLQKMFGSTAFVMTQPDNFAYFPRDIKCLAIPRNKIQEESVKFLTSQDRFVNTYGASQQALLLDTGDGKTIVTIMSILYHRMNAMIITHIEDIKQQWIDAFKDKTNIPEDKLINIDSSDTIDKLLDGKIEPGYIYFVNHRTIQSYAKKNGWGKITEFFQFIKVGIKVYDEAHKEFKNIIRMDFFTNTKKTIYLTANFGRSNTKEGYLFKRCFSSVVTFGEETKNYEEKRRHIIAVFVLYRSNPTINQINEVNNSYGLSAMNFMNYSLYEDPDHTLWDIFLDTFLLASRAEGKILITVPRIKDIYFIYRQLQPYLDGRSISYIHYKIPEEERELAKESDVIVSTIDSCGTGKNISKLRSVINLTPFSSEITTNQLSGRLREYSPTEDTFFWDLIDIGFPACEHQYTVKKKYLKKKCKAIKIKKMM